MGTVLMSALEQLRDWEIQQLERWYSAPARMHLFDYDNPHWRNLYQQQVAKPQQKRRASDD